MIKRNAKFDPWECQSLQVTGYDAGDKYAQAALMRKRANGFMEHSCFSNEFTTELQKLIDEGCSLDDIYIIASANNTIHWRTEHEFTEESIEQFLKDAAKHWKDERKRLREIEKEKVEDQRQKELKALADAGISTDTLQMIVEGKLKIPSKDTKSGLQPGWRVK